MDVFQHLFIDFVFPFRGGWLRSKWPISASLGTTLEDTTTSINAFFGGIDVPLLRNGPDVTAGGTT
jgi:hypothetical protein